MYSRADAVEGGGAARTSPRKKCLLVMTREFRNGDVATGRERVVSFIKETIAANAALIVFRVPCLIGEGTVLDWTRALLQWLRRLAIGRPMPFQVMLFSNRRRMRELLRCIETHAPDTVYFDGARCVDYLRYVRRHRPTLHLVCDLDDLMSRRMKMLYESRMGISLGYLSKVVPGWLRGQLYGAIGRLVARYEFATLRVAERQVVEAVDACVLLSSRDAELLREEVPHRLRERVISIPPAQEIRRRVCIAAGPLRFVFIGTDALTQNRLTIEWLIELWRVRRPAATLHIYGNMQHVYKPPENVRFEGFAESLDTVYTVDSILIAPAFLGGGIKTKIVEAIANGVIVVANESAFEGLGFEAGGLKFDEIVSAPASYLSGLAAAAEAVQKRCEQYLNPRTVSERWLDVLRLKS